jgi:hypothetical protein
MESLRECTFSLPPSLCFLPRGTFVLLWHGGVSGAQRIARHLWRMFFALFIASSSFVFGTATTVPGVISQDGDSFSAGCPAADLDDFLAGSRVVHECVQKDFVTKPSSWEPAWGSPSKPCLLAERRSERVASIAGEVAMVI